MKLTELEPELIRYEEVDGRQTFKPAKTLAEASGVMFLCPACMVANGGPVGTHRIICWSRQVPDYVSPGPGRWRPAPASTGLENLTLVGDGGSSSIQLTSGCRWHGFVTDGEIVNA